MIITYCENKVIIKNIINFIPKHVFECGQCFRWNEESDGSYTGVSNNKVVNIKLENGNLIIDNTNKYNFENYWLNYFDLDRDYSEIKKVINIDENMDKAINFGNGIRILNQDIWETVISYIISSNNRILMIKRAIDNLSIKYGEFIQNYKGKDYYSFPKAEKLSAANIEDIRNCKVGFRDKYILETSKYVLENSEWLKSIEDLDYKEASIELKKLKGVGDKVAHCILLFSMRKFDAFPVDVWIKRIMNELYTGETSNEKIKEFAMNNFGIYSGFAQQYLFYYARENNIGK